MRAVDTRRASPTTDGGPGAASVGRALAALVVTTLAYWLMNGAQVFETAVIVPAWSADPPTSLALLRGEHAPDLQTFWIVVHSLHELTFLAAVALCWRLTRVRNVLLLLLAVHVAVRVWTVVYFAAGIIAFGTGPLPAGPDPDLVAQVELWRDLNLLRVAVFVAVSVALVPLVLRVSRHRHHADGPLGAVAT